MGQSRSESPVSTALRQLTATHCPYCALQCGMSLAFEASEFEVKSRNFPTNRGGLCRKGWTAGELLRAGDRLTAPLVRRTKGEALTPCSWEEAIAFVVSTITRLQRTYGRDAIALFGGGGLTNEKGYALGKFARVVLQTKNIDYNGRFCMASGALASRRAFGIDRGLPFPIADIASTDVVLLAGANPAEVMPPIMQYFEEQRARGGRLIVVDPRRSPSVDPTALHLQLTPGTDLVLANGLLHIAVREHLIDEAFIAGRTVGFEAVRRTVASYWPDRVERITGVPVGKLVQAAHLLAEAATGMVITARGPEQQARGTHNAQSYINLALALGKVGRPLCGYGTLTGQGNGQGGREHGQKADQLPGYRSISDPVHRAEVASVWGIDPDSLPGPGLPAQALFRSLGEPDGVRALWVMGSNLVVSAPDARALEPRLAALELLVVSDLFLSETARLADVVFPVCQWAEEEGTTTNLEGRVCMRERAAVAPAGVRSDLEVLKLVADGLGRGEHLSAEAREVFEELRRASAGGVADYAGISYERIRAGEELFWPCPDVHHPGTPRLFLERFATDDGRARFIAVHYENAEEEPSESFPLYLTTGRVLAHYQSGTQTRRIASLCQAEPEPFVEIHPDTAQLHGASEGDPVFVETRRGKVLLRARLSSAIRLDTLFVPFHWGHELVRANALTTSAVDPDSGIPAFKVAAASLRRANLVEPSRAISSSGPH